jgi:UDPglucose 6-dehydrogenase
MHGDAVVDTRNLLEPMVILDAGLSWLGLGRPRRRARATA